MLSKSTLFKVLLGTCLILFCNVLFAQRTISGKITDASTGQPVIGSTIAVRGSTVATQTNAEGDFTITVPNNNSMLVVSSVGYEPQDISTSGRNNILIGLKSTTSTLNEVVVTGYTSQRKKDITGSVVVVNVKGMKAIPSGSPEQTLQGQAAGVNVITSGAPGGPSNILIRGVSSFGNSDPLVIIDGIQSSLHDLNVNDIESIQILKDAGAASVYGVRGSNGVIVVTTKKGTRGKTIISYDAYYGTQQPLGGNPFHLLNTQELANALWIAEKNAGQVGANGNPQSALYGNGPTPVIPKYITPGGGFGITDTSAAVNPVSYNIDYNKGRIHQITKANQMGTDWFHAIFRPAAIQSHTLSMSGGSEKSTFLFSVGYFNQQGTLINTYLKRYNVRMNSTFNVGDRIRVGENAYLFYKENPQISYFGENQINYDYREQPIIPILDIKGNYAGTNGPELGNSQNPYANQRRTENNKGYNWDMIGNLWAEVDILKNLTARTSFGGSIDNGYNYSHGFHTYENLENNGSNSFTENAFYNSSYTWTNSLTYNAIFAQKHSLKLFGATEAIKNYGRGVGGNRINYFTDDPTLQVLSAGGPTGQTNYSYTYENTLFSLIGRLDYAYNDRYLLSATVRRDGSSVFGSQKRYGVFPAFSVGWRVSQENFMKNISWLNDLKLRGSYGVLGSQNNILPSNSFTQYASFPGGSNYDIGGTGNSTQTGYILSQLGNLKTGWEEDKITNIGLDAVILHNTIDFTIEYYKKAINGLLFTDQTVATVGGSNRPAVNIGDVQNKGFDISANYHGSVSKDFKFNIGVNVTTYKNTIVDIPGSGYFDVGGTRIGNFVRQQSGQAFGAFYGYKIIKLWQKQDEINKLNALLRAKTPGDTTSVYQKEAAPGRFEYLDANGDGKISDSDRVFFGNPNPKFTYGFNLNATFKNFDLTMIFYGSQGNDVINYVRYWTDFWASFQGNKSKDLLYNSWSPTNLNAKTPINENVSTFSTNNVPNSYYLENGSFLKCKSLIIGYTVSPASLKRVGISHLRFYAQVSNLFTITKYTGLDPEVPGPVGNPGQGTQPFIGIDYGNYPNNQKMYLVGANLSF